MFRIIVPRKLFEFHEFSKAFLEEVKPNMARWGFDQAFYNDTLILLFNAFEIALNDWANPLTRTREKIIAKNFARKAFEAALHKAIGMLRNLPHVTEEDLEVLNINIKKRSAKILPAPIDEPLIKRLVSKDGTIKLCALNLKTGKRGKPEGAAAYVVAFVVADVAPLNKERFNIVRYSL